MSSTQQPVPSFEESCLVALEQALAESWAQASKKLEHLLSGFQHLEMIIEKQQLILEQRAPTPPKNLSKNITPIYPPLTSQAPPPALPTKFNRDCSRGQAFPQLVPDLYPPMLSLILF